MSNSSGGRRDYIKHNISGPCQCLLLVASNAPGLVHLLTLFTSITQRLGLDTRDYYSSTTACIHVHDAAVPSPLHTSSDTASYATAQASSIPSECSTAGSSSHRDDQAIHEGANRQQHPQAQQQHSYTTSLHSISSIRTAHFTTRTEQLERLQRSTTPDGSMEVSPSKTPLRDRMNRLSIASTASGMVNFDDEDREEAERRWLEEEEAEIGTSARNSGGDLPRVQEEDEQVSSSEDEMGSEEDERDHERRISHMTPSRSSTSLKSILKKSIASAEGIAVSDVSIHVTATPHRTVTWSPSTLPPAKSPPATEMSPEHPRGPLAAAEAYLLNLGQRQQDEYYQGFDSPYRQTTNRGDDDSVISSEDSAMEIEEALLSRSSTSISPQNMSAASDEGDVVDDGKEEESTDSLRMHGSASKRGTAFMDRLKGLIPSPEGSFVDTQHVAQTHPSSAKNQDNGRILDPSMSNILDTSAPAHSISQDVTVNDSHVNTTLRQANGPKPFLLRQSVILEEPSILEESTQYGDSSKKGSTSPTTSPDRNGRASVLGGRSFASAMQRSSPSGSPRTPIKHTSEQNDTRGDEGYNQAASPKEEPEIEIFETPAEDDGREEDLSNRIVPVEDEEEGESSNASPSPSLRALPSITPSSSSSSLIKLKPESPFTSLVNHLLSTQDELLSHRADQKTMLISLVSNLRGELASRDRQLDMLESSKKSLERTLRKEREDREKERRTTKDRMTVAMKEVDDIKNKLTVEIKRRDDAFKEGLLFEKTKRELVEKQLETLRRDNDGSEEIEFLRMQLQDMREELDEQKVSAEQALEELQNTKDLLTESKKEQEATDMRLEASQRAQEDAQARADMLSDDCHKLRNQSSAAEKQISKLSADFEHQMTSMRTRINQSESANAKLRRELEDVTHALQAERLEQTRQYDMSASVQESLRIDNDRLSSSVARLERSKEHSFHQLQIIKKDTAAVLAQKDERIHQLEAEVMKRSLDRRSTAQQHHFDDGQCATCKEANERTGFLESEVVRLREVVGKMRMESADREVKIARLAKTREQLKEDIDGLNIALEAKQQEVSMLKRESHRLSGENTAIASGVGAGGVSMVGMITSTTRPHSRILKGRPSSLHDTTQAAEAAAHGSTTFTAEQRRRSLRARTSLANPGKRISIHRSSVDTPSVLSSINANSASGNILNSALTSRRTGSKDLNIQSAQHDKAYEAASLVKSAHLPSKLSNGSTADKENAVTASEVINKTRQQIEKLPSVPSHAIVEGGQLQMDTRKRSNSLVAPIEA